MKKIYLFFIISIVFCSCETTEKKITVDKKTAIKKQVHTILNDWHLAATNANFDAYFDKMDSVAVFIGTDASENWNKKEFQNYSKPHFDKGKAWDFKVLERTIYINNSGDFIWFDELLNTQMGICRGSGVLEKTSKNWLIKQYVLSAAIPNEDMKAVIEIKKNKDSLFLQKLNY